MEFLKLSISLKELDKQSKDNLVEIQSMASIVPRKHKSFTPNDLLPNTKIPSLKHTFNLINANWWALKRKDRLRRKYRKGGKRSFGYFSKFNTKYVLPI